MKTKSFNGILLLVLIIVSPIGLAISSLSAGPASATSLPRYIYLTYATTDTAHTITVNWRADTNYIGEILYDNQPRGGIPSAYSENAVGTDGLTTPTLGGYFYHVEITGLNPNTIYYFICGNPNNGWSQESSFRTAPVDKKDVKFGVSGDSRWDPRSGYSPNWPIPRDNITKSMASNNPDFIIFGGDYLWTGEYQDNDILPYGYTLQNWPDTWDNWLGAYYKYARTSDNRLIPLISVIGNHEIVYPEPLNYDPSTQAINFYTLFDLPGNSSWYAMSWGPDVRIIVLDSEVLDESSNRWHDQLNWLQSELANDENYLWKVVAFHEPIVNSYQGLWSSRLNSWASLFTEYGVTAVFQGHVHYYERSYPLDYPPLTIASPQKGVAYVTAGGWGAPFNLGASSWYTAHGPNSVYEFTLNNVFEENKTFRLNAVDINGNTFDTYMINETNWPQVSISPASQVRIHGSTLNYAVTVANIGIENDNYVLTVTDNENWAPTLLDNLLLIPAGGNVGTTLSVTIPENAAYGAVDGITVTARSSENENVWDSASVVARSAINSFKLSINPGFSTSMPGENTTFKVWVKNMSDDNGFRDNYTLVASDDAGWQLLIDNHENVLAGENVSKTLTVIVPGNAIIGTKDNILVTAISGENAALMDNGRSVVSAEVYRGTASLRLKTEGTAPYLYGIYKAIANVNLLVSGDNLHLIFLKYDNKTVENNKVIWSRTTPNAENVIFENLISTRDNNFPYPPGSPTDYVKRVKLILTDNSGTVVLDNMAWYTVVQDDWGDRISWIVINWALHTPSDQDKLGDEISTIVLNWALVPTGRDQHDFSHA